MNISRHSVLNFLGVLLILGSLAGSTPVQASVQYGELDQEPPTIILVPRFPNLVVDNPGGIIWTQFQGDGDEVVEPGETFNVSVRLLNIGSTLATKITSTLTVTGGNALVQAGSSLYPNIPVGSTATNTTLFRVKVLNTQACDSSLGLRFFTRYSKGNRTTTHNFTQPIAPAPSECNVYNNAPTAVGDAYPTTVSTALTVPSPGVLVNDTDPDQDPLTASLVSSPSQGTLSFNTNGSFTYTPVTGYTGDVTFTYLATDGLLNSNTVTVTITMTGNQPPVLALIPNQSVNELALLTFTAAATDPESPPEVLTYALDTGAPSGASIDPATGVFSWTPDEMQGPGVYTPTVIVRDNGVPIRSDTQAVRITVGEVNAAPVVDPIPDFVIRAEVTFVYTVTVTDSDYPPEAFSFTLDPGAPAGASIDIDTGVFSWTPTSAQALLVYPITVRVADDGIPPLEATGTFQLKVGDYLYLPIIAK